MAMAGSKLHIDSQPKSFILVWGLVAAWCCKYIRRVNRRELLQ